MEDIIQILVFAVSIVIFAVGAIRKQKNNANKTTGSFNNSLESLFDAFADTQQHTIIETQVAKKPEKIVNKVVNKKADLQDGQKAVFAKKTANKPKVIKTGQNNFNLKSAFIYSEIINRKYF